MDSYIDIRLLPDPEFHSSTLMNVLFSKLHRILAEFKSSNIAVSFPEVDQTKPSLGSVMRLHGHQRALEELMGKNWMQGMREHALILDVIPAPKETSHVVVRRVQAKSSPERLRRRQLRRHNLTEGEVLQRIPETVPGQKLKLPYISLKSQSTDQNFRIFIEHLPPQKHPVEGGFNAYGLSAYATVPWF
jgi:CRISPR-associated endonuclease Csy4